MNAKKLTPDSRLLVAKDSLSDSHLKYLSASQRAKTRGISKDWKLFTYGLLGEILNKI
jgi:hypothetical protein